MNFGITIITIFYIVILIVPGIFFKKFYFQSKFTHEFNSGNFADKAITSIFWGLLIQILALTIVKVIFGLYFNQIYLRANNIYNDIHNQKIPLISYKQLKYIFAFFCFSISLACILGHISHKLIRFLKLDISFSSLRFANEWNYIFRNEITPNHFRKSSLRYHSTELDIIVKESKDGVPRFYSGILRDYFLTESGELDKIVLMGTKKRVQNENGSKEFIPINGDTFIIPYCNVENINLRYNYVDKNKKKALNPVFKQTIAFSMLIFLVFMLIIPWFTEVSLVKKLISFITIIAGWVFIMTFIMNTFNNRENIESLKTNPKVNIIFLLMGLIFLLLSGFLLNLIHQNII